MPFSSVSAVLFVLIRKCSSKHHQLIPRAVDSSINQQIVWREIKSSELFLKMCTCWTAVYGIYNFQQRLVAVLCFVKEKKSLKSYFTRQVVELSAVVCLCLSLADDGACMSTSILLFPTHTLIVKRWRQKWYWKIVHGNFSWFSNYQPWVQSWDIRRLCIWSRAVLHIDHSASAAVTGTVVFNPVTRWFSCGEMSLITRSFNNVQKYLLLVEQKVYLGKYS